MDAYFKREVRPHVPDACFLREHRSALIAAAVTGQIDVEAGA